MGAYCSIQGDTRSRPQPPSLEHMVSASIVVGPG